MRICRSYVCGRIVQVSVVLFQVPYYVQHFVGGGGCDVCRIVLSGATRGWADRGSAAISTDCRLPGVGRFRGLVCWGGRLIRYRTCSTSFGVLGRPSLAAGWDKAWCPGTVQYGWFMPQVQRSESRKMASVGWRCGEIGAGPVVGDARLSFCIAGVEKR